jgi:SAM-dependent methyltransferase
MHFLDQYLPKHGTILDAGGGPGRYAIELAKRGYNIVLLDLIPEMLQTAHNKTKRVGFLRRIRFVEGSIENLSMFKPESFDAVLALGGSLNHLLNGDQRVKAASELVRVTKNGAPLFVSVISRIGLLKTILIMFQNEMQHVQHHLEVGDYMPGMQGEGFTAAHWFLPEELCGLFHAQGIELLEMAGLEGLSSHHPKETNRLFKDQQKWKMWMDILLKTCTHPSVVGCTEHFLFVGRKPR